MSSVLCSIVREEKNVLHSKAAPISRLTLSFFEQMYSL